MKSFYANERKKFISVKLRNFCRNIGISIKYIVLYIYVENNLEK